jgi:hypothetical protein
MLTLLAAPGDAPATWAREALACKTTPKWQRTWAERVLAGKHKAPVTVFVTNYGLWDRHPFKGDYYHIASNVLPKGTVVYLEADRTLKVVTNCGARRNDRWARHPRRGETRKPAAYWVDRWTKRARHDNANTRLWVVGNAPWPH